MIDQNLSLFLISVITPVHNSEDFISDTINSVKSQTHKNWELILIDDCSSDKSLQIIEKYEKNDPRIKILRNEVNSGPAITRNKGIKEAKGEFITFIDADDIWDPTFLTTSLTESLKNGYEFVFSSYRRYDENLNPYISDFIVPARVNYQDVLKSCPISCLTAFIDIRRIGKVYMPEIKKRQDWGLWLAILKKVTYAHGIEKPLATYRIRRNSVSRSKRKLIPYVWKVYREVEGFNLFKSSYYFAHWAMNGFKKYYINR